MRLGDKVKIMISILSWLRYLNYNVVKLSYFRSIMIVLYVRDKLFFRGLEIDVKVKRRIW